MSQHYVIVVTSEGEISVPVPPPELDDEGKSIPVSVSADVSTRVGEPSMLRIGGWGSNAVAKFVLDLVVGWYRTVKDEEDEDV